MSEVCFINESGREFASAGRGLWKTQLRCSRRYRWVMVLSKGKVSIRKRGGETWRDSSLQPHSSAAALANLDGDAPQIIDAGEVAAYASGLLTLFTSKRDEPNANQSLGCLVFRVIKTTF